MNIKCTNVVDCESVIRNINFNVNGEYCLTTDTNKKVKLWNPYNGKLLKIYGGHGDEVLDAVGSCDSSNIASGSKDKSVIIWDVSTGHALRRLRGHSGQVNCVRYNENSTVVFSGSIDNTVSCWDTRSRSQEPIQVLHDHQDVVTSICVSEAEIFTGCVDCSLRKYDLRNMSLTVDFVGDPISSIYLTADRQGILASTDDTVHLFDRTTGARLSVYTGHKSAGYQIQCALNHSDTRVISGSMSGEIFLWELITEEIVKKCTHNIGKAVQYLDVHPTTDIFITASGTNFKIWQEEKEMGENTVDID